ncbi:MAG: hypothetical protein A3H96_05265 [Acidobacteria bacterium RIFCSPLOWO2_02_FULL_67_36]|nr:MAG: hypothetical protein A3H96_05265 [Acidobacteria bacterium RIFCSPLOWO2_02_FULL_67_36]
MMLTRALAPDVDPKVRAKGRDYFESGAVVHIDGAEWSADAIVRGARDYTVRLARDGDRFTGSCDCPFFTDRRQICKHVWAALLAAERGSLLGGEGPAGPQAILDPVVHEPGGARVHAGRVRSFGTRGPTPAAPPPPWQRFLSQLQQDLSTTGRPLPAPRFATGQIVYAIDVTDTLGGRGTVVNVLFRYRKKNGEWSKPRSAGLTPHEAEHLRETDDRDILSLLIGAGGSWTHSTEPYYDVGFPRLSRYVLNGPLEDRLLPMMAGTGRLHLQLQGREGALLPVVWDNGDPWRFDLDVVTDAEREAIRIDGEFTRGAARMALGEPVLVLGRGFLFTRTSMARLDPRSAFTWIARLRASGPVVVPRDAWPQLTDALARSGVSPEMLPGELRYEVADGTPRPVVRVSRPERQFGMREDLQAVVQFDYGGSVADMTAAANSYDPEHRRLIRRDPGFEQASLERLQQLGFRYTWSYFESKQRLGVAPEQFSRVVATLVKEGWRVEAHGRAFRTAEALRVEVSSGIDWFDLHGDVDFGDGRSAPFPRLLAALQRGEEVVVLDDGSVGLLPEEWLRRYAAVARFGELDGDRLRFQPSQAALLDALLAAQPSVAYDEVFRRVRDELRTFGGIAPADPPRSFTGTLREYQREALGWFAFLRRFGFGGCLADDMGLGKTVMVLALLDARRTAQEGARRPSLAVVPRSLVFNWIDEARRFAPGLKVLDYTGTARDASHFAKADLVLTTYGTLRRDITHLKDVEFDYAILDEAQAIKNAATASAKAARLVRARYRLALSGTPIENHLGELWSLFEFLNPGVLGSAKSFQRAAADVDLAWLSRAMRPFILRRTKAQVAPELPPRTEQTLQCELEPTERRHYDELRAHYRQTLLARVAREGVNRSKMQILEALLRLRQAACHPGLIDRSRAAETSAKFEVLLPMLAEVIEEGHKALVFSQFTSLLALLRPRLEAQGIVYEYLDGRTRDRAARVERFQNDPACPVFLISLKAGGLGLNLTAAEYVFLLDPWWNPAVEAQAIDRAHRIGQARHVFAYRLLARDTVEEKVAELQQSKRDLADAILRADAGLVRSLRAEDLELLLS